MVAATAAIVESGAWIGAGPVAVPATVDVTVVDVAVAEAAAAAWVVDEAAPTTLAEAIGVDVTAAKVFGSVLTLGSGFALASALGLGSGLTFGSVLTPNSGMLGPFGTPFVLTFRDCTAASCKRQKKRPGKNQFTFIERTVIIVDTPSFVH